MLFLDTETTGLECDDVILEIGVCDDKYNILFNKRIRPAKMESWCDAQEIHGISFDDVKDCPEFPEILDELKSLLLGKTVCIFNARYDLRLLRQTCESHKLETTWLDEVRDFCIMYEAGHYWPRYANYYGGMKLSTAVNIARRKKLGVPKPPSGFPPHSAIGDCLSTAFVSNTLDAWSERR